MLDIRYQLLDSRAFDEFLSSKDEILSTYAHLNNDYERIRRTLLADWEGRGADAFSSDSSKVRTNLNGIYEILKLMCDTLTDCRLIFEACDSSLGDGNREAFQQ